MKKMLSALFLVFVLFFLWYYCSIVYGQGTAQKGDQATVIAGDLGDFPVGTIKSLPQYELIIFRDEGGIYAISSKCTHLGCLLSFKKEMGMFLCPCHGSGFNKDGVVQHGPAHTNLPWFSVAVDAQGKIKVDKSKTVPAGTKYEVKNK